MFWGKLFEEFFMRIFFVVDGFSLNCRWGFAQAPQGLERFAPALAAGAFLFSLSAQRKRNKKKSAGCRSRSKKSSHFPKRKELANAQTAFRS